MPNKVCPQDKLVRRVGAVAHVAKKLHKKATIAAQKHEPIERVQTYHL